MVVVETITVREDIKIMANNDILQYLRETPHNTNVNVVKGMIGSGSGSGAIEMTTIFDEDISLSYQTGSQYVKAMGHYSSNAIQLLSGYLKITFDDITFTGAGSGTQNSNTFDGAPNPLQLFSTSNIYNIAMFNSTEDGLRIDITSPLNTSDSDLETYCQTPHHLKIEWFTI